MGNFKTATWYLNHSPRKHGDTRGADRTNIKIGLGLFGATGNVNSDHLMSLIALKSLTDELLEAHDTSKMIECPDVPGTFLLKDETYKIESNLAIERVIQADMHRDVPRWSNFPDGKWLRSALSSIATIGFQKGRTREKVKLSRGKSVELAVVRSNHRDPSSQPASPTPPADTLLPPTQPTASIHRMPNTTQSASSAILQVVPRSHIPLHTRATSICESPQTHPIASQLSRTSKFSSSSILQTPARHVSYLSRMILVVHRERTTTPWTKPLTFFLTDQAVNIDEAKRVEKRLDYKAFKEGLAENTFLNYDGEKDRILYQHSKVGPFSIEYPSQWRTAFTRCVATLP
jgi:hypothetical protein